MNAIIFYMDQHEGAGAWFAAIATFAAVIVALLPFYDALLERGRLALFRSRAGWLSINQSLTLLELLLTQVRQAGAATPVNWAFLRVGTRAAVAAANQALAAEIPNLDLLNLAVHTQTLAVSFNEDLERRAVEMPVLTGQAYLHSVSGLENSLAEQRRVATRLKAVLKIVI